MFKYDIYRAIIIVKKMSRFVFYSKSADKDPGMGSGEILDVDKDFSELKEIQDWRKILSNFHLCSFKYDDKTFNSAEHAFHYAKYKTIGQQRIASVFSLESGNNIATKNPAEIKSLAGKNKTKSLYVMDDNEQKVWANARTRILTDILYNKFNQCYYPKKVLKRTKDAELWHFMRGSGAERWTYLEEIRDNL